MSKKLRCLNYIPLKSLEKEGLEAKLIGTKRFKDEYPPFTYPFFGERPALVKLAARGTKARAYRAYWRNMRYVSEFGASEPPEQDYHIGTFIVKLYELNSA